MLKRILPILILILVLKVAWAAETIPQTQTVLRSYFTTGSVPTQTNYWELIDTMFYYINESYSNSLAAAQSASNAVVALQAVSQASAKFTLHTTSTTGAWSPTGLTVTMTNNIYSLSSSYSGSSVGTYTITATFATNLASDNYVVYFPLTETANTPQNLVTNDVISKTVSNFVFQVGVKSGSVTNWVHEGFIIQ